MIGVVVIEDELTIRRGLVLTTAWEDFEAEVIGEAADGIAGEELIARLHPDLVITDIRMPGRSGIEMIRNLSGRTQAAFIILSGYEDFGIAREGIELGVLGYLLKPVDEAELSATMERAVRFLQEKARARSALELPVDSQPDGSFLDFLAQARRDARDSRLGAALKVIHGHYRSSLSAHEAASLLGMSESSLGKLFKSRTGYTFLEYLTRYRMQKAVELLKDPSIRIYEVADLVGYADYRHFGEVFKKILGLRPSDFRKGEGPAPE